MTVCAAILHCARMAPSKPVNVRIPPEVLSVITEMAEAESRTVSNMVLALLREALAARKGKQ